jgi:4-amino-4-deoxy-L-arabinose transferase-like glycosyltransferase
MIVLAGVSATGLGVLSSPWGLQALMVMPVLGLSLAADRVRSRGLWHSLTGRWFVVILMTAFALRTVALQERPLWYDEAFAALYASLEPAQIVHGTTTPVPGAGAADVHPLLYYFLLHGWIKVVGQSPLAVRYLSVVLGTASVALLGRLAKDCFDRQVALTALALAAANPFHIAYSQETRMYALLALAALLAAWGMLNGLQQGARGWWSLYAVAGALTLYAHNLGAFVLLALNLLAIARGGWRARLPELLLANLAILALFAPWLLGVLPGQLGFIERGYWLASPGAVELLRALLWPTFTFYEPAPLLLLGLGLFAGAALLIFTLMRAWRSRSRAWWFVFLGWMPVLLLFALSQWRPLYLERALLPGAFLYLIALGWLLASGGLPTAIRVGLMGLLTLVVLGSLIGHYTYRGFPRPPFPQAVSYLEAQVEPRDAVVHTSKLTYLPMHYYRRELPGEFLADPAGSPQDTLARPTQEALGIHAAEGIGVAVGAAQRVWLVSFQREMEEVQALGVEHPALTWLEGRMIRTGEQRFGDLIVTLYERGGS